MAIGTGSFGEDPDATVATLALSMIAAIEMIELSQQSTAW